MNPTSQLERLTFFRYQFELELERPLEVPAAKRSVLWRGAFGSVFRSLVCHDVSLACASCPLLAACPYPRVFAPHAAAEDAGIKRFRDPPRPFVLIDPGPHEDTLPARESLILGLVVVGSAVADLPYFVVSLRRLGEAGIGRRQNRFSVKSVRAVARIGHDGEAVFQRGTELVKPVRIPTTASNLSQEADKTATRATVQFVTPTDLRGEEQTPGAPGLGLLIRRARDRMSALSTFFGGGPLDPEPRQTAALADDSKLVHSAVGRSRIERRSQRTGERHSIGGWTGSVTYESANLPVLMPWLRLAEVLGVGKHATFGNGRIVVTPE